MAFLINSTTDHEFVVALHVAATSIHTIFHTSSPNTSTPLKFHLHKLDLMIIIHVVPFEVILQCCQPIKKLIRLQLANEVRFFFVRAGMMGWLLINLSVLAKNIQVGNMHRSTILYQLFSVLYILDYFFYEEYMTSTWDIIAERLGFMLVFGDLVWIPFTFSVQGWWLLGNKVELTKAAVVANCLGFLIGWLMRSGLDQMGTGSMIWTAHVSTRYRVFKGANKQKHVFKKNPKAHIWGKPPKVIGGKLLVSGYWGVARHCDYLGDLLLALSLSLPCGASSIVPYFYPLYLLILLIWRERRDEVRCAQKYKEDWKEYCKLVPWRILPYIY
ncbi:delta(14)-sterol reductase-like [Magnolia sinica]|uniref:delta(14)-sterol reductase-like n=1 Tax=Magnolia sinica TaxID=86752 RepID=UPI00265B2E2F|nr:delta(14)-sterol reductase-like [Magnolia sinica]